MLNPSVSKSRGYTRVGAPIFIKSTQFCYISGSSINLADLNNAISNESIPNQEKLDHNVWGQIPEHTHTKLIAGENQITAFGIYASENIIAYAERGSSFVKLFKWFSVSGVVTTTLLGKLESELQKC